MILLYICSFYRVNGIDSVNQAAILKFKKLTHEVKILITHLSMIAPTPQNPMIWIRKPIVSPMAGKNSILGKRKQNKKREKNRKGLKRMEKDGRGWNRKKLKLINSKQNE